MDVKIICVFSFHLESVEKFSSAGTDDGLAQEGHWTFGFGGYSPSVVLERLPQKRMRATFYGARPLIEHLRSNACVIQANS